MENADKIAAKYGIKIVGFWNDHPDHCVYIIYDTPSMDAMMGMAMDPMTMPLYSFQTMTTRPVLTANEVLAMMKK